MHALRFTHFNEQTHQKNDRPIHNPLEVGEAACGAKQRVWRFMTPETELQILE